MKQTFLYLLIGFFTLPMLAQNDTIWYDENWVIAKKNEAHYFRPGPQKIKQGFLFVDYYKNGKIQMKGMSLSDKEEIYHGTILWYFQNGNVFQIVNYDEGVLNGMRSVYFESGSLKSIRYYKSGVLEGPWEHYFQSGGIKEKGYYSGGEKHGIWDYYDKSGFLVQRGEFESGEKTGTWEEFHPETEMLNN